MGMAIQRERERDAADVVDDHKTGERLSEWAGERAEV